MTIFANEVEPKTKCFMLTVLILIILGMILVPYFWYKEGIIRSNDDGVVAGFSLFLGLGLGFSLGLIVGAMIPADLKEERTVYELGSEKVEKAQKADIDRIRFSSNPRLVEIKRTYKDGSIVNYFAIGGTEKEYILYLPKN